MSGNRDAIKSLRIRFQESLGTYALGQTTRWMARSSSTNTEARAWADSGAPHGALVFADHQTAGKGRHNRTWSTAPGLNLTVSLVLRPELRPAQYGLITLAASLAVLQTIRSNCAAVSSRIKWPNDILVDGKKCCGMLLESAIGRDQTESFVILGIGLNVNQTDFPDTLQNSATSIMLACGRPVDRSHILADLLGRLETILATLEKQPEAIASRYQEELEGIGKPMTLTDVRSNRSYKGILYGIDTAGALQMEIESKIHSFHAGDVRLQIEGL
ncbi:MAG: biotin--[acetyl-CoA-carboxylase] ligase [Rhodothermia bacterium]|nr:MAG: biotin--[acetyl-CoA-carboxylase] ligase [Rhodothermia bacterium]